MQSTLLMMYLITMCRFSKCYSLIHFCSFLQAIVDTAENNAVVSPASTKTALALLLIGAGGKSARQIIQELRLSENEDERIKVLKKHQDALKVRFLFFLHFVQFCHLSVVNVMAGWHNRSVLHTRFRFLTADL